jgi:proteasome lid subunit RPN8/RPN11
VGLIVKTPDVAMPEAPPIDLGSLGPAKDLPEKEIPRLTSAREPRFQVVIGRSVLEDIRAHGRGEPEIEVCGVLVGNVYRDQSGPYLHIEANVRGNNASGKAAQVTFTADTWNHIQKVMEEQYDQDKIVGWYHTHPGFGIFLSDMDLFIQNNFFGEAWQVAYVYDPKSNEQGLFLRRGGQTIREKFLVDEEKDGVPGGEAGRAGDPHATQMVAPGTVAELSGRVQEAERRVRWHGTGLGFLLVFAVLWPVAVLLFGPQVVKRLPPDLQRTLGLDGTGAAAKRPAPPAAPRPTTAPSAGTLIAPPPIEGVP